MRVLIVFHGWLPGNERPVSGGALRAWRHGEALTAAGHEVLWITRDQDHLPGGPPTFASPGELRRYAAAVKPDRILAVQPEEAPAVAGLGIPLCVDLYAPRLLEAVYEDATGAEAVRTLRAIDAGDLHLFSNPRQRWFYLGLMALAGVDLRRTSGAVVPLSAPEAPRRRRPKAPVLVMGGVSWPWQDPVAALRAAAAHLARRGRGRIEVYGGRPVIGDTEVVDLPAAVPPGEHLLYRPALPYDALLRRYAGATAALDVMAPNPEREVALAFRHMDYLACGLPIITGRDHALAPRLAEAGAGWLVGPGLEGLEEALDAALDDGEEVARRGAAARALARGPFAPARCEAPLLDGVEAAAVRERRGAALPAAAELAAALEGARADRRAAEALQATAEAEVAQKRAEVAALSARLGEMTGALARLSSAVDEVARYRNEATGLLRDELAAVRSDLEKKALELAEANGELHRTHDEVGRWKAAHDRLAGELEGARAELARLRQRRWPR